jgi:hypothetical protein
MKERVNRGGGGKFGASWGLGQQVYGGSALHVSNISAMETIANMSFILQNREENGKFSRNHK